jgi:hypothetical protein
VKKMVRTTAEKEKIANDIADRLAQRDPAETEWRDAAPLRRIAEAFAASVSAESKLADAVADARAEGYSWAAIAAMLGVSRQNAQQRFRGA